MPMYRVCCMINSSGVNSEKTKKFNCIGRMGVDINSGYLVDFMTMTVSIFLRASYLASDEFLFSVLLWWES